jgi:hypothetical protein
MSIELLPYFSNIDTSLPIKYNNQINKTEVFMNKAKTEKQQQKKELEHFNNVTHKTKIENQNQTHNSVKEGIGPINQKK